MKSFCTRIFLSFLLILAAPVANALADTTLFGYDQDSRGPKTGSFTFTPFAGVYLNGKYQDLDTNADRREEIWAYGLRFGYAFTPFFEVESRLMFVPTETTFNRNQNVYAYGLDGLGQLSITEWFTPYVLLGMGAMTFDPGAVSRQTKFAVDYGLGLKFFVFKNLALRPEIRGATNFGGTNTAFVGTLNLTYYAGRDQPHKNDRDQDGILDSVDACPDSPETMNEYQDDDGCPDEKPVEPIPTPTPTPAPEPTPTPTPTPVADQDSDGILDKDDKCPKEAEVLNGYNDEDGCPDSVLDEFSGVIEGIYFDSGKDTIQKDSYKVLDRAVSFFKKYPLLRLRIEGHTDTDGTQKLNARLSQGRANNVRQYLIHRGIAEDRVESVGYGSSRPVASNSDADGKAKNRRIEFRILNPEVLSGE